MDTTTIVQNINATIAARYTLAQPADAPLELSALCDACKRILDYESSILETPACPVNDKLDGEVRHQSLEETANAAKSGCHLCVTAYMNLDPASLRAFHRYVDRNYERSTPEISEAGRSWGYAKIQPIARDQARLSFRWTPSPLMRRLSYGDPEKKFTFPPVSYDPYTSRNESWSTQTSSSSDNELGRMDHELVVELILMNPVYTVEPGVRTIGLDATNTASEECFEIAKEWLRDCTFDHMKCSAQEAAGPIEKPTFLLDISLRDSSGNFGIKLVEGIYLDPFTEYVTLSHCWGISRDPTKKRIRLHSGTLGSLQHGVAMKDLPKTFWHAAIATQRLGYKYLWIDALCIMHDSEPDVLREIADMYKIYGNATVNLAATGASDDSQGLFFHRNVESLQPASIDVSEGHGITSGPYKVLRSTIWDDLVDSSPLAQRAWVVQERALSKRTIHFTRSELLWECQQMCCSEVFPKGLPVMLNTVVEQEKRSMSALGCPSPLLPSSHHNYSQGLPRMRSIPKPTFNKRTHHQRTANWHALVELYTSNRQTYTSDKLLGIIGLAQQYLSRNRLQASDYFAGLWRPSFPHCLLWRVQTGGRRPPKYRAPSWTWASIDGQVTSPAPGNVSRQSCVEIIDVVVNNRYGDPLGLVEDGFLRVRGFMGKGSIRRHHEYYGYDSFSLICADPKIPEVVFENAWFDEKVESVERVVPRTGRRRSRSRSWSDKRWWKRGQVETIPPEELLEIYLLPVTDIQDRVEGLILTATPNKGEFKRIGVFEIGNGYYVPLTPTVSSRTNSPAMNGRGHPNPYGNGLAHGGGGGCGGGGGVFPIDPEIQGPIVDNWDRFKRVMKGDPKMDNYEERLDHTNAYWFASDFTYTIRII